MAINRLQFQPGLSLPAFLKRSSTDAACERMGFAEARGQAEARSQVLYRHIPSFRPEAPDLPSLSK